MSKKRMSFQVADLLTEYLTYVLDAEIETAGKLIGRSMAYVIFIRIDKKEAIKAETKDVLDSLALYYDLIEEKQAYLYVVYAYNAEYFKDIAEELATFAPGYYEYTYEDPDESFAPKVEELI